MKTSTRNLSLKYGIPSRKLITLLKSNEIPFKHVKTSQQNHYIWDTTYITNEFEEHLIKLGHDEKNKEAHKQAKKYAEQQQLQQQLESYTTDLATKFNTLIKKRNINIIIHAGPTGSGKTYQSIQRLKSSNPELPSAYLAPLRLLANEVFDTIEESMPCNLITGEERIINNSHITSSTTEMFSNAFHDIIVLDEAHMMYDQTRGHAWTNVMLEANCNELHVITPNSYLDSILYFVNQLTDTITVHQYERKIPIQFEFVKDINIKTLKEKKTAFIAFSKKDVIAVQKELSNTLGIGVSAIYGAMPPSVRKRQVELFNDNTHLAIVATDAIGMGLNLPIDQIIFLDTQKFDGTNTRQLTPEEVKQIAGRTGRPNKSNYAIVSGFNKHSHDILQYLFNKTTTLIQKPRYFPKFNDLNQFDGNFTTKIEALINQLRNIECNFYISKHTGFYSKQSNLLEHNIAWAVYNLPYRQSLEELYHNITYALIHKQLINVTELTKIYNHSLNNYERLSHVLDTLISIKYNPTLNHIIDTDIDILLNKREKVANQIYQLTLESQTKPKNRTIHVKNLVEAKNYREEWFHRW